MQNTYQDLITDIQSKNPQISGKLEGEKNLNWLAVLNLLEISLEQ